MSDPRPSCVFLDRLSIDCDDLDFSAIAQLTRYHAFDTSTPENLLEHAAGAEIIICNKVILGAEHFRHLPSLKLICVIATGTNNIDLEAANAVGIRVMNVKDYAAAAVSQHVMLLMLALAGNFLRYQADIAAGRWQRQDQFCLLNHPILSLQGKTLGLIGYGHIARAVEQRALAFDMNVIIAQSLRPKPLEAAGRLALERVLQQSDFISLHCPLSEYSRNLFTLKQFERMKNSAFIINTARGGIIHEVDLLQALERGEIAGAALDCIEQEPPTEDNPLLHASKLNLILTPHNAWGTREARQTLVNATASNIQRYLNEQQPS